MTLAIQQATSKHKNDGSQSPCARIRNELNRFNNQRFRLSAKKMTLIERSLERTLQLSERNFYESS